MTTDAPPRERGIIMTGESVRAIMDGRKTQTRRVVTDATSEGNHPASCLLLNDPRTFVDRGFGDRQYLHAPVDCAALAKRHGWPVGECDPSVVERLYPRHMVGDRLWIRETWALVPFIPREGKQIVRYAAGDSGYGPEPDRWRSPIHMPRWASRLTLEITAVRVERVQEITNEDAIAEGLSVITKDGGRTWKYGIPDRDGLPGNDDDGWSWQDWDVSPVVAYARAWDQINGKRAPWNSNPWVFVLTFRRLP